MNKAVLKLAQQQLDPLTYKLVDGNYDLIVHEIMKTEDKHIKLEIAEINGLDENTVDYLILDKDSEVRRRTAAKQALTLDQIDFLVFDECDKVVMEVAKLSILQSQQIDYIINERDPNERILIEVSKNKNLLERHVKELYYYSISTPEIKENILNNNDKYQTLFNIYKIEDMRKRHIRMPGIEETFMDEEEWEKRKEKMYRDFS